MTKMKREKTDYISLFLKKVKKEELPEPKLRPLRKDQEQVVKKREAIQKLDYDIEELQAPIYKKIYESWGISGEEIKSKNKKEEERFKEFQTKFKGSSFVDQYADYTPTSPTEEIGFLNDMCKEVTVDICKQKICVDQPVPLTVDSIRTIRDSDGTFNLRRNYDRFSYFDEVDGYSTWTNLHTTYHRHSRIHEGGIFIRTSAELVEAANVRQIGVRFDPLRDNSGQILYNGVWALGGYRPTSAHLRSRGRASMFMGFMVDIKLPGGNFVNRANYHCRYRHTGWVNSRVTSVIAYPPRQALGLNGQYPAGTQFLIDVVLSYEIEGNGQYNGHASASYNLEVQPYMNLEACSWEWPDQKVIYLDEEGNP